MRRSLGAVAASVVVLAALVCVSVGSAGALTKSQLKAKTLSLSNLPTGWSVDNSSSSGGSPTGGCLKGVKQGPKSQTKVSVSYKDGQLPQLDELLGWGKAAQSGYTRLNHTLAGCKHFEAESGGRTVNFTVGAMSFPKVGNATSAYSVTFSVEGINAGFDVVLFRVGSIVGLIGYADTGQPDPGQLQKFVTEAVEKVEGKSLTIPTTV